MIRPDEFVHNQLLQATRDPEYEIDARVESLINVARKVWTSGDAKRATPILAEALQAATSTSNSRMLLNKVALAQAEFGDPDGAQKVLNDVAVDSLKSNDWDAAAESAISMASLGRRTQSLQLVDRIGKRADRHQLRSKVALAFASAGAVEASLDLVQTWRIAPIHAFSLWIFLPHRLL